MISKKKRKENKMYIFAVRAKVQPGKAEEFAQKWKDFYGSLARDLPGFQQAYYAADRATDTTLAVWVWSARPDEAQLRQAMQEFSAQIRDLTAGPPSPEWYEVLQHI
jgi:heme-degrading monooxygenase HmoA